MSRRQSVSVQGLSARDNAKPKGALKMDPKSERMPRQKKVAASINCVPLLTRSLARTYTHEQNTHERAISHPRFFRLAHTFSLSYINSPHGRCSPTGSITSSRAEHSMLTICMVRTRTRESRSCTFDYAFMLVRLRTRGHMLTGRGPKGWMGAVCLVGGTLWSITAATWQGL